tara:strand:+ start:1243 stop:1650 length:408 start_codon:yes stop_codon:yes gene_type:complete
MTDDSENCIHDHQARIKQLEEHNKQLCKTTGCRKKSQLETLISKVVLWHRNRNLIDGSSDKDQVLKLAQELGELSDSVCKNKDIKDDIGDMLVVMLNIVERNGLSLSECLETAYDDIKDRKGKMVDGVFVKEGDQ